MAMTLPRRRTRTLRWLGCLFVVVIAGLYLVFPTAMAVVAVFPHKDAVGAPPPGFEDVRLDASDGTHLAAWYAPPSNGAAIILVHGAGNSRESVRDYATMLAGHGYGVLALDLRGHGESDGLSNRLGWQGTRDVEGAAAFLLARPEVERIGGLGLSMGGEVLLGASADVPAMQAVVADGATRRCTAELTALPSERSLVRSFTARVMYTAVEVLTGQEPPDPPLLDAMQAAAGTQYLLIAAGNNDLEVRFNELFAETLGGRAALWVAPDVSHTGAFSHTPDEYATRVIAFFDAALRDEAAS